MGHGPGVEYRKEAGKGEGVEGVMGFDRGHESLVDEDFVGLGGEG